MSTAKIILIGLYVVINAITAYLWNAREMKRAFVEGQCFIGAVFTNLFYAPAWLLKLIRAIILVTVR